jgi:copper-binding protein NosD
MTRTALWTLAAVGALAAAARVAHRDSTPRTAAVVVAKAPARSPTAPRDPGWRPPIGIPAPAFGLHETAPPRPEPWTRPVPDYYYVEASSPKATDADNALGWPGRPRRTIPSPLPAGAVVEVYGAYEQGHTSPKQIVGHGTAARPVFVRGVDRANRAQIHHDWQVSGAYTIFENLEFAPASLVVMGQQWEAGPTHHVVVRDSEMHGTLEGGGVGIEGWYGEVNNVVFAKNFVHDNGNVHATVDQDVHCIHVGDHVNTTWILDNEMARCSGDGIQINATAPHYATTHHIYVGRNVSHHHKQTGFWVKQATDVIFSENIAYALRPSDSSMGQCMGSQYGPDRVWFIANRVHDCDYGIAQMSDGDDGERVTQTFVVGNVIYGIHRSTLPHKPTDPWGNAAIMLAGGNRRFVVNNTIYDVDSGVNSPSPFGSLEIVNNIIADVSDREAAHVVIGFPSLVSHLTLRRNVLADDPRLILASPAVRVLAKQLADVQSTSADPHFVDAKTADFHLRADSTARGRGERHAVYDLFRQLYGIDIALDIDGAPRRQVSLGAYETSTGPVEAQEMDRSAAKIAAPLAVAAALAATGGRTAAQPAGPILYVDGQISQASCATYAAAARACGAGGDTAFKTLRAAAAASTRGTTVILRSGTYNEPLVPAQSGTEDQPITFAGYPNETATLTSGEAEPAIQLISREHVIVQGLTVVDSLGFGRLQDSRSNVIQSMVFKRAIAPGTTGGLKLVRSQLNRISGNRFEEGNDNLLLQDSSNGNVISDNAFVTARHTLLVIKCSSGNAVRNNVFTNQQQKAMEILDCEGGSDAPIIYNATKRNLVENNVFGGIRASDRVYVYNAIQHGGQYTIVRRNVFFDALGGGVNYQSYASESLYVYGNRLYHNTFYANRCFAVVGNRGDPQQYNDNQVINNVFFRNTDCQGAGDQVSIDDKSAVILTSNAAETTDPGFVDAGKFDFHLTADSRLVDRAGPLTTTRTAGSGTSLPVRDVLVFYDGNAVPGETGDEIQLLGTTDTARVVTIDYKNNLLTLDRPMSWRAGQGVGLKFAGMGPDFGAFERDLATGPTKKR